MHEITDAAMSDRAECVMLNRGPHVFDALKTLDDILRRVQAHHSKKQPMLRQLKLAHGLADDPHLAPIELPHLRAERDSSGQHHLGVE